MTRQHFFLVHLQESLPELNSPGQLKPDFVIIGSPKAGTTTLWEYLDQHPEICMSSSKEPEVYYFDSVFQRGSEFFAKIFTHAKPGQILGEASTAYSGWSDTLLLKQTPQARGEFDVFKSVASVAKRIHGYAPQTKLIYILRNPAQRLFSQLIYHDTADELHNFDRLKNRGNRYLQAGTYATIIQIYLELFPRDQLQVLLLEDLAKDPEAILLQTQKFLNVTPQSLVPPTPVTANVGKPFVTRRLASKRLHKIPGYSFLSSFIPNSLRNWCAQRLVNSPFKALATAKPLDPSFKKEVYEYYKGPNRELSEFLGRDLSHWNNF